jgi:hypothetical protein
VITIGERQFPSIDSLIGESEGLHAEFQEGHVALLGGRPADSAPFLTCKACNAILRDPEKP